MDTTLDQRVKNRAKRMKSYYLHRERLQAERDSYRLRNAITTRSPGRPGTHTVAEIVNPLCGYRRVAVYRLGDEVLRPGEELLRVGSVGLARNTARGQAAMLRWQLVHWGFEQRGDRYFLTDAVMPVDAG